MPNSNSRRGRSSGGTFDFDKQLVVGSSGEKLFLGRYGSIVEKLDGRTADFIHTKSGALVELKTDTYEGSPNYFMERYSSLSDKSPGGPWQSLEKNVYYYVYMFPKENSITWFPTGKLVSWLDDYIANSRLGYVMIRNRAWTTAGYKIPRKLVTHLEEKM